MSFSITFFSSQSYSQSKERIPMNKLLAGLLSLAFAGAVLAQTQPAAPAPAPEAPKAAAEAPKADMAAKTPAKKSVKKKMVKKHKSATKTQEKKS
jgi:hypothetical protein